MRYRRRSTLAALLIGALVAVGLSACTTTSSLDALPEAYRTQLATEAGMAEMAQYFVVLREAYKKADRAKLMTNEEFVLAVKADISLRETWETLRNAVRNKQRTDALWPAVLSALGNFETIVNRFDATALASKPSWARR